MPVEERSSIAVPELSRLTAFTEATIAAEVDSAGVVDTVDTVDTVVCNVVEETVDKEPDTAEAVVDALNLLGLGREVLVFF
jgi:hypothetical protein